MLANGGNFPDYTLLKRQLQAAGVAAEPAEVHGLLSGLLCTDRSEAVVIWYRELFEEIESGDLLVKECQRSLYRLYERTRAEMIGEQLGFTLLLPDDEQPLQVRVMAMVAWCQGFLYGLGLSGVAEQDVSDEIREVLKDFSEIIRMDWDYMDASEASEEAFMEVSEEAFMEINEFVWVAVMLVREELREAS